MVFDSVTSLNNEEIQKWKFYIYQNEKMYQNKLIYEYLSIDNRFDPKLDLNIL
tara:strand:- start:519 stop:677 length:159 start_codon:yes stop_codon:yes gene_type:complete